MITITVSMAERALRDPTFLARMPEFSGLAQELRSPPIPVSGCAGCGGRRSSPTAPVLNRFLAVLSAIPAGRQQVLSQYFGDSVAYNSRQGAKLIPRRVIIR